MSKSKYKTRVRYTLEFRQQIIDLVRAGRPIPELVQQFGVTATSIHNWLRLARKQDKPATGELTINEREELERLRRENRQLLFEWLLPGNHPNLMRVTPHESFKSVDN